MQYGIEGTIWLTDEVAAGLVRYDPDKHEIVLNGSITVSVFQLVKVHISVAVIGGSNSDGTGRPTVRILMTDPVMGQQPDENNEKQPSLGGEGGRKSNEKRKGNDSSQAPTSMGKKMKKKSN